MFQRIESLPKTIVVGRSIEMSFANNLTQQVWQSFMPRRNEVTNRLNDDFISLQIYPNHFPFENFNPSLNFVKWACVAVENADELPEGMETMTIDSGLYAIFNHKGLPSDFPKTFNYIFGQWFPHSNYVVDVRPHFEVLGQKYKNNDPESEEEIWIPIKARK